MPQPLRVAVIGAGHIGRLHAQKYAALGQCSLHAVVDTDLARARDVAQPLGATAHDDYRAILHDVQAVSVAVPTALHNPIALACLQAGVHVLVEKPFARTIAEAEQMVESANSRGLVLQVGHIERYNAAVLAARDQVVEPLFIESHRLAPFRVRGTDVNVVLDLMIHDIDLILSFVQADILSVRSIGVSVLSNAVDIAKARIEFAGGCIADVTASRVSEESMRKLRIFQADRYISIDCQNFGVRTARKATAPELAEGKTIIVGAEQFQKSDAMLVQLGAFVDAVANGQPPVVSGAEGKRALEVALEVCRQMNTGLPAGLTGSEETL